MQYRKYSDILGRGAGAAEIHKRKSTYASPYSSPPQCVEQASETHRNKRQKEASHKANERTRKAQLHASHSLLATSLNFEDWTRLRTIYRGAEV